MGLTFVIDYIYIFDFKTQRQNTMRFVENNTHTCCHLFLSNDSVKVFFDGWWSKLAVKNYNSVKLDIKKICGLIFYHYKLHYYYTRTWWFTIIICLSSYSTGVPWDLVIVKSIMFVKNIFYLVCKILAGNNKFGSLHFLCCSGD